MKKIASVVTIISSIALNADMIRVEGAIGGWNQKPSGNAYYNAGNGITGTNKFDENKDTSIYAWILLKHPVPIVPNIRLEYVDIEATGQASGAWNGMDIPGSSKSDFKAKEYDIVPYYNILDNTAWTTIDLGIDIKIIDADFKVEPKGIFKGYEDSTTVPIPLGYFRARVEIPTTNIGLESDIKYISISSSKIYDFRAKADYTFDLPSSIKPALEIGYRRQKIKIDEDDYDVKTDVDFSGIYGGLMFRF